MKRYPPFTPLADRRWCYRITLGVLAAMVLYIPLVFVFAR